MLFPLILAGASLAAASVCRPRKKASFDTIVTFGDSYTDNGRLNYYFSHGGKGPAPGEYQTVTNTTASGGLAWSQYVAEYAGANLVDYAVSGATCSNEIILRYLAGINRSFPSVMDDEIPSFTADVAFKTMYPDRTPENTVYALWIGTNDLGYGAFLTDSQAPGTTISDFVDCIWSVFDAIYKTGGRRFVLLNEAPLELSPLYALPENGGTYDSQYWQNKTLYNMTEYNYKMKEYTTNVNTMFEYGVPFQLMVKSRWPRATFDLFDVHSLLKDVYSNPKQYLDAPYNATGYWHHCVPTNNSICTDLTSVGPRSGFMWYDELHPSDKTDSIIAKHFLNVIAGNSSYGTNYG